MKKRLLCVVLLLMLLISFSVSAIDFSAEETYNSVAVISTKNSVGSGFFVSETELVTNAHVVDGAGTVTVNLYDGSSFPGVVSKVNVGKDLALVTVEKPQTPLEVCTDRLQIGQEVYAIGAPRGMSYTMTKGIVSALDRPLGDNSYIQIDASVNSGNSGGPLLDASGRAIGIVTLKATDAEGIGYALPIADVLEFLAEEATPAEVPAEPDGKLESLIAENRRLVMIVCVSLLLNVILLVCCIRLRRKHGKTEKYDEFDFEIEIEE